MFAWYFNPSRAACSSDLGTVCLPGTSDIIMSTLCIRNSSFVSSSLLVLSATAALPQHFMTDRVPPEPSKKVSFASAKFSFAVNVSIVGIRPSSRSGRQLAGKRPLPHRHSTSRCELGLKMAALSHLPFLNSALSRFCSRLQSQYLCWGPSGAPHGHTPCVLHVKHAPHTSRSTALASS